MSVAQIRALADADASCGAKAHGLARLIAAGQPVPDGFVLDAGVFRDVTGLGDIEPDAIGEAESGGVGTPTALSAGRGSSPVGSIGEAESGGVGTPTALPAGRGSFPVGSIGHALAAAAQRIAEAEIPPAIERDVAGRAAALGRLAVRSSASIEDGALGSAAGVFASLTDVAPRDVWRAIRAVWTSALTPLAVAYARRRGAAIAIAVIVQRFVPGARMTVYTRPIGAPTGDELWLSCDGRLDRVSRAAAERPEAQLALAAEAAIDAAHGADVELVLEPAPGGVRPWIVQARPILHPVRRRRSAPPPILLAPLVRDGRRWTWDIAHNPDPLSPAQAGLVERIDRAAWSPYALRVCGGYLYTAPRAPLTPPAPPADRAELASRIAAIEARLARWLDGEPASAADAASRYVGFMQIWTCELSPLVAAARRKLLDHLAGAGHPLEQIPALAASLIGPRRAPRDPVMSPAWDVAVPTFAEARAHRPAPPPGPPAARSPLAPGGDLVAEVDLARAAADAAEHDDLWFARAQWLVRRALLARSRELGLPGDDIFWIPLDDVITLRTLDPDDVHRRASAARAAHARAAEWDMPLTVHGEACCEAPGEPRETVLRGVGVGARTVGRVVRFASLASARPVGRGDVVVTRAVTPALAMIVDGCAALVSETGGLLDHGAALAREIGITCVVGCTGAWAELGDGMLVTVDGDTGIVRAL